MTAIKSGYGASMQHLTTNNTIMNKPRLVIQCTPVPGLHPQCPPSFTTMHVTFDNDDTVVRDLKPGPCPGTWVGSFTDEVFVHPHALPTYQSYTRETREAKPRVAARRNIVRDLL